MALRREYGRIESKPIVACSEIAFHTDRYPMPGIRGNNDSAFSRPGGPAAVADKMLRGVSTGWRFAPQPGNLPVPDTYWLEPPRTGLFDESD